MKVGCNEVIKFRSKEEFDNYVSDFSYYTWEEPGWYYCSIFTNYNGVMVKQIRHIKHLKALYEKVARNLQVKIEKINSLETNEP